jgi:hypothetical protein
MEKQQRDSEQMPVGLELGDTGASAVFILLSRAATHPTSAFDQTIPYNRHRSLAGDHVSPFSRSNPPNNRGIRPLGELAAGTRECGRSDSFALAAIDTSKNGSIHPIEGHQTPTGITYGHADLDVQFIRFGNCTFDDSVCFS